MSQPEFWNSQEHAKDVSQKADELQKEVQR